MKHKSRFVMVLYDILIFLLTSAMVLVVYTGTPFERFTLETAAVFASICFCCLFLLRIVLKVYSQIWRYAGPSAYMTLLVSDGIACATLIIIRPLLPYSTTIVRVVSLFTINLLFCIAVRLIYQWVYQNRSNQNIFEKALLFLLKATTGISFAAEKDQQVSRIKIAIIGAGSIGALLADELLQNTNAAYLPVCFVDIDKEKVGRVLYGLPVLLNDDSLKDKLNSYGVQEVVFALPNVTRERRTELFQIYKSFGYKLKTYDYPLMNTDDGGKRQIHDFNIEDLLFRSVTQFLNEETMDWYRGKNVLITGGGGSIGSELARQIAKCGPSRLVILDVYENGAYDIQQELKSRYGDQLNLRVEIANVCDKQKIEKIFADHTPDIVLHAAAHKHVPLMERNVCEAVTNNVFGTLNVVEACEKYHVKRFIMISTDKAVNPTNVMGATKRMCEMIVQSRKGTPTSFSATRFGNVLGSNGSVIPLFKRQIANGGPITLTDKRIVRYFMTIPEASQLVMTSGAMAKNGELYVLDMGKPVKILELAENMIRLSGLEPYKDINIIETGLRPGEKLYEELLIKSEELDKTDNNMIFVERDHPLSEEEIQKKLDILKAALETQSNRIVKKALMDVVPTYHTPEEVNEKAIQAEEMRVASGQ